MKTNTTESGDKMFYYRPLAYFSGLVLKNAGHGAEDPKHRAFYETWFNGDGCDSSKPLGDSSYLPGVVIAKGYRGDRIRSDSLASI